MWLMCKFEWKSSNVRNVEKCPVRLVNLMKAAVLFFFFFNYTSNSPTLWKTVHFCQVSFLFCFSLDISWLIIYVVVNSTKSLETLMCIFYCNEYNMKFSMKIIMNRDSEFLSVPYLGCLDASFLVLLPFFYAFPFVVLQPHEWLRDVLVPLLQPFLCCPHRHHRHHHQRHLFFFFFNKFHLIFIFI